MKLVESFREENFTSASISLLAISWAILGLHLVNKSFNEDIDKSMYEIICINDGSADGSLTISQEYAKNTIISY